MQSRVDIALDVSMAARASSKATILDAKTLNKTVAYIRSTPNFAIVIRKGLVKMAICTIVGFSDAAFANVEGVKSQWGQVVGVTHFPKDVVAGHYDKVIPLAWYSVTVKRVVRSTLAAEGYAALEGIETAACFRWLLMEVYHPMWTLKQIEGYIGQPKAEVYSDSKGLVTHIGTDVVSRPTSASASSPR